MSHLAERSNSRIFRRKDNLSKFAIPRIILGNGSNRPNGFFLCFGLNHTPSLPLPISSLFGKHEHLKTWKLNSKRLYLSCIVDDIVIHWLHGLPDYLKFCRQNFCLIGYLNYFLSFKNSSRNTKSNEYTLRIVNPLKLIRFNVRNSLEIFEFVKTNDSHVYGSCCYSYFSSNYHGI